jgi:hypothetical protein
MPSQSLSRPSQASVPVGLMPGAASSQSRPHVCAPPGPSLQQVASATPSPSWSRKPKVVGSQSSSRSSTSQTSVLPGKRTRSLSSQSSPPQTMARCPSSSASSVSEQTVSQASCASRQAWPVRHGAAALTQPRSSASGLVGVQRSAPLQNRPSSQSSGVSQRSSGGRPASSPGGVFASPHPITAGNRQHSASTRSARRGQRVMGGQLRYSGNVHPQ